MADASVNLVHVKAAGVVNFAIQNPAMPDAMNMVNAKMEHACVLPAGMESIAQSKVVHQAVQIMDNAVLMVKETGNAVAMMVGMVSIVRLHWSKIVLIIRTMTKVF